MATATAPSKSSARRAKPRATKPRAQNGNRATKPRAQSGNKATKPQGQSGNGSGKRQQEKTAGGGGALQAAKQGLKAGSEAEPGAGKFETLRAFWRVGRLAWRVARGKRPKAKQLRKAAGSAGEVGAKALAGKAPKLPLRKLGQALSNAHVPHVPELPEHVRRLPVQRSVDVAVPIEVAYEEWMRLESLPEGAHCVKNIERRQGRLVGELDGLGEPREWEAEIRDERRNESFAWRSTRGSDVAGLITFHRLSERLTRLELQLDVVPTGVGEAASLALHLADRRAESELRQFKSRLETISPDAYASLVGSKKRTSSKSTKRSKSGKNTQTTKNQKPNKEA